MASETKVTAITIFLDPGPFLQEAIDSVLAQTHGDLEYVLVDDGSTDGSSQLAQRVAAAHPGRVRYLSHEGHANLGMSRSRNAGVAAARGQLIAFLDADDVWLPDAVERQVAVLSAHPSAQMVIGATTWWTSWEDAGRPDEDRALHHHGLVSPPTLALERIRQRRIPPSMNALLMRRSAIEQVGGFESDFTGMYEDQAFLLKFLLEHDVVVHDEVVDRYRQHSGSAVARAAAAGTFDPDRPSRDSRAFRQFAAQYVAHGAWRGTPVHREARWYLRWDRWPRLSRHLYRFRPGVLRRAGRRIRRRVGAAR